MPPSFLVVGRRGATKRTGFRKDSAVGHGVRSKTNRHDKESPYVTGEHAEDAQAGYQQKQTNYAAEVCSAAR